MTNVQLFLSIGIPSFMVLFALLLSIHGGPAGIFGEAF